MNLAAPEKKILQTDPAEPLDAAVTGVGLSPRTVRDQPDENLTLRSRTRILRPVRRKTRGTPRRARPEALRSPLAGTPEETVWYQQLWHRRLVRAVALHPAKDLRIELIAQLALDQYPIEIVKRQE